MFKLSKLLVILLSIGCLSSSIVFASSNQKVIVRFMDNKDSSVNLNSGYEASGTNILFDKIEVNKGESISCPSNNPTLEGYDFNGWYTDKEATNLFDFSSKLVKSITLYAGYVRNSSSITGDKYEEIKLSFEEIINDNLNKDYIINGVMNNEVINNKVCLPINAINKLIAHKDNCLEYINYERKSNVSVSATYDEINNKVIFNVNSTSIEIKVEETKYTISTNSYYESKASKYDSWIYEDYSTLMCGSSSMENWSTSKEDLSEFVTYNIGIGGTIVEEWDNLMNPRLVYVNNPKTVVYYLGINNIINNGNTGEETGNQLVNMFEHIHAALPNTLIHFILINYVPGYMKYKDQIDIANNIVKEYAVNKEYMNLINAGSLLLKSDGTPSWAYFKTDGLHMSLAGYLIWGNYVKENMINFEKEYFKR